MSTPSPQKGRLATREGRLAPRTQTISRVYIEISNICNLSCSFCPPIKRKKKSMTEEEFIRVIEQIRPFTSFIYFHVKGEPLLHPLLSRFLDISQENGMQVNITTNATLLKERGELLLNHPAIRQVNLSLHSFGGGADEYKNEYIERALAFARAAAQKGIYTVMRLWNLSSDNKADNETLEVMQKIERAFDFNRPLINEMGGRKSVKLAPFAFVGWEKEFEWPSLSNEFISDTAFCYGMRRQIAILADGTVVPCCLDANGEARLGNLFITPFEQIINSKHAKAIKHGFENRVAVDPLCKRCSFRTKFDER